MIIKCIRCVSHVYICCRIILRWHNYTNTIRCKHDNFFHQWAWKQTVAGMEKVFRKETCSLLRCISWSAQRGSRNNFVCIYIGMCIYVLYIWQARINKIMVSEVIRNPLFGIYQYILVKHFSGTTIKALYSHRQNNKRL